MGTRAAMCLGVLAALTGAGCAQRHGNPGAAPFDSVHIRSGDTMPPANPPPKEARPDTTDSTRADTS